MSLGFDNLALWPFALLIGVPILLHLFARVRPPVYAFSSVEFLQRVVRNKLRVRKPQEWLALLIRTLIIFFLVGIFLKPLFFAKRRVGRLGKRRNVALIIDATASMAYAEGGQTRFAAAAGEASEIISGLNSSDTANIIWLKRTPTAVFPEMGSNFSFLRNELRRAGTTLESGDIARALQMAREQLGACSGEKEICIISDFQQVAWADIALKADEETDVVCVQVGQSEGVNYGISNVYTVPARPLVGEEVNVFCEVQNYSDIPQQLRVLLVAGEGRQQREINVGAWEKASLAFRHKFKTASEHILHASIASDSSDRFPFDNERWAIVRVREKLKVGLVASNKETSRVWRRALNSFPWAQTVTLQPEELAGAMDLDALVYTGYDGKLVEELRSLAVKGCTLICEPARTPGTRAGVPFYIKSGKDASAIWEKTSKPLVLQISDTDHPVFRLLTEGDYGNPAAASLSGRIRFEGGVSAVHALMSYQDGQPALGHEQNQKNFYLWNMALEESCSDLGRRPEYLFLVGEIIQKGRQAVRISPADGRECGSPMVLMLDQEVAAGTLQIVAEDGAKVAINTVGSGGGAYVSVPCLKPGFYTWKAQDKPISHSIINFPRVESDLRCVPRDAGKGQDVVALSSGQQLRRLRKGSSLWPLCLVLVLLFVLSEGLFLLWSDRS